MVQGCVEAAGSWFSFDFISILCLIYSLYIRVAPLFQALTIFALPAIKGFKIFSSYFINLVCLIYFFSTQKLTYNLAYQNKINTKRGFKIYQAFQTEICPQLQQFEVKAQHMLQVSPLWTPGSDQQANCQVQQDSDIISENG